METWACNLKDVKEPTRGKSLDMLVVATYLISLPYCKTI